MLCSLCDGEIPGGSEFPVDLHKVHYTLCEWCALKIKDQFEYVRANHMANIFWGAGHVNWTCWETLREFIRENHITEVLEFGIGLSSELFVNEGLKVVGFDACRPHVTQYQNLLSLKNSAEFYHYEYGNDGPPVERLFGNRKWDFVFVDGPQERSKEVEVAMRVASRFIYLHDPNLGEQGFFPNADWIGQGTEPRLFIKRNKCLECGGYIDQDVEFCEDHEL